MVRVLQERRVRRQNYERLMDHLKDLRSAALYQPGYVMGETLVKGDDPVDVMVIGTWISEEHWKAWAPSQKRIEMNDLINHLLMDEPRIGIYKAPTEES